VHINVYGNAKVGVLAPLLSLHASYLDPINEQIHKGLVSSKECPAINLHSTTHHRRPSQKYITEKHLVAPATPCRPGSPERYLLAEERVVPLSTGTMAADSRPTITTN
jgi:hypothetical protein